MNYISKIIYESYWETKDGRKLLISEMSNEHAMNAAKMMQKKIGYRNRLQRESWQVYLALMVNATWLDQIWNELTDLNK